MYNMPASYFFNPFWRFFKFRPRGFSNRNLKSPPKLPISTFSKFSFFKITIMTSFIIYKKHNCSILFPSRRKLKKRNKPPNSRENRGLSILVGRKLDRAIQFFVNDKGRYYSDFEERNSKKCWKYNFWRCFKISVGKSTRSKLKKSPKWVEKMFYRKLTTPITKALTLCHPGLKSPLKFEITPQRKSPLNGLLSPKSPINANFRDNLLYNGQIWIEWTCPSKLCRFSC